MKILNLAEIFQIPTNKLDFLVRSTEVSSYIPGRARLYSKELVNNEELAERIKKSLLSFGEIDEAEINTVSGSVLILYDTEKLRKNKELKKVEDYIRQHARRK